MGSEGIELLAMKSTPVTFGSNDKVIPALPEASQIDEPIETAYVRMLREEADMEISFNITVGVANLGPVGRLSGCAWDFHFTANFESG